MCKKKIPFLTLLSLLIFLLFHSQKEEELVQISGVAMTMPYRVLIDEQIAMERREEIEKAIEEVMQEVDERYNTWNLSSQLSFWNRSPKPKAEELGFLQLYPLFHKINQLFHLTKRRFDPTVAPLFSLWKENLQQNRRPSGKEIDLLLSQVGWDKMRFHQREWSKSVPTLQIDSCGVAKGYAVDLLIEKLATMNINSAYVEWGGDLRVLGRHPTGRKWKIYLPLDEKNPTLFSLSEGAVAGSGNYVHYWSLRESENEETSLYSHIVDPQKGELIQLHGSTPSATYAYAPFCWLADGLATAAMTLPREEIDSWLLSIQEEYPSVRIWYV